MSLSRILNDTPPSPPPVPAVSANSISRLLNRDVPVDNNLFSSNGRQSSNSPLQPSHLNGTNPESHDWTQRHNLRNAVDSTKADSQVIPVQPEVYNEPSHTLAEGPPTRSRKRRKTSEQPIELPRRVTRHTAKVLSQEISTSGQSPPSLSRSQVELVPTPTSDLEDCPSLWRDALGMYILETRQRERGIETWFEQEIMERCSAVAKSRAQKYSTRIEAFPSAIPPLTTPFPDSPSLDEEFDSAARSVDGNHAHRAQDETAQDAARLLEDSVLGITTKRRAVSTSDGSDFDVPLRSRTHTLKRRRFEEVDDITDELERSVADDNSRAPTPSMKMTARRNRAKQPDDLLQKATKRGKRKRLAEEEQNIQNTEQALAPSAPRSETGTPLPSAPTSPHLKIVYELSEQIPPLRRPTRRLEGGQAMKRIKAVEEAQQKVWSTIVRKEIPKVQKFHVAAFTGARAHSKKLVHLCTAQGKKPHLKSTKSIKETTAKSKRVMRDMLMFWRKNEKEERDGRRRAEKEAVDRAKEEEEKREVARQARKLEFLISQTELYSHFVGNKLKTTEAETMGTGPLPIVADDVKMDDGEIADQTALPDLDFNDEDETNLRSHARHNAQAAIAEARRKADLFDKQTALERQANQASNSEENPEPAALSRPLVDFDSDELNFQNPTSLTDQLSVRQPKMLQAQLKEYQLKGLNWLATLYERGINGILADEMGLGKTVQSISLLAYLAEAHDIWGPFLVIAPASTLHNWQQEVTRFVPELKALPYWGNVKDRAILRKFWNRKQISYNRDAPFHILITSYQLVLADEKYFQRVKWQYMILDEAQNIKNSSSARWKTLLGFQCRNRLLLTGTPIQNSMHELWALLHFIMPTLFDSHDEFSEWFSKDIETAAENKGGKLNEHQLRRLHMILKPFMLRRVKRNVQNELSEKIEIDIFCDLSFRQRVLYRVLRSNVSIKELLEKAANIGDADSARSLMNLVMQFRKVCNHPELFERADVVAPFSFCHFGAAGNLSREGDLLDLPYSTRNPIQYSLPVLFYTHGGFLDVSSEASTSGSRAKLFKVDMSIWTTGYINNSMSCTNSCFSFASLLDIYSSDLHYFQAATPFDRLCHKAAAEDKWLEEGQYLLDPSFIVAQCAPVGLIYSNPVSPYLSRAQSIETDWYPRLHEIRPSLWAKSCLSRPRMQWHVPRSAAPPIQIYSRIRSFVDAAEKLNDASEKAILFGLPPSLLDSLPDCQNFLSTFNSSHPMGLLVSSPSSQTATSKMQVPDAKRLIYDSAKLARLDLLLQELKAGDHKVLIYFQMTKMMDLMEEYLIFRQYKYLRLDGSSKLEDRRDMVIDWQTRPDIFIFLLSTRAGGLGINLTAADTVIFYDHDWNPSNDSQAMDRAHRLGQMRQVTVYRLITRGTIDERIIQLARVKKDVQDIVVGNKQLTDVAKPSEIVSLLLNDDELANLESSAPKDGVIRNAPSGTVIQQTEKQAPNQPRDLWDEDDFFGSTMVGNIKLDDSSFSASTTRGRGRRRDPDKPPAKRGRKPGSGRGKSHKKKSAPAAE